MRQQAAKTDYSAYVVDPATALQRVWQMAEYTASDDYFLVKHGVSGLSGITFAPGQSSLIVARPGHGKSLFLQAMCRKLLDQMAELGSDGVVLYVTLEEPSVKLSLKMAGYGDVWRQMVRKEISAEAAKDITADMPRRLHNLRMLEYPGVVNGRLARAVTPGVLISTVEQLVSEYGRKVSGVFLDYAQLLRADTVGQGARVQDHILEVSHALVKVKQSLNCPMFVAVQSARASDQRGDKMPTLSDLQQSSSLEQDADSIIALRRPIVDGDREGNLEYAGNSVPISSNLMMYRILKARQDGCAGDSGCFSANPVTLEIRDLIGDERGNRAIPASAEAARNEHANYRAPSW